jgi:hypothetical protein
MLARVVGPRARTPVYVWLLTSEPTGRRAKLVYNVQRRVVGEGDCRV